MPIAIPLSPGRPSSHYGPVSPRPSRSPLGASASPPPIARKRSASRSSLKGGQSKENVPISTDGLETTMSSRPVTRSKGLDDVTYNKPQENGNGGGRTWRDGSVEVDDGEGSIRSWKNSNSSRPGSVRSTKSPVSPGPSSPYNGLPTLPTVPDDDSVIFSDGESIAFDHKPPPPSLSTATASGRPVTRKRRSSSIKRKPSPGVVPTKAVDWEIPRKTLHSSIGFLTLGLYHLDPPSLKPLITVLSTGLVSVTTVDLFRLRFPAFAEIWESYLGFLMRESERDKINGVIWYLVGVIWVLALYPRDVAVVSILTLSWSDTTASTLGRLWGRYTPPLPPHFPGIKLLPFAPRKSLAGFLAATVTGILICIGFWWNGSGGRWHLLDGHWSGLLVTSVFVGIGGAVVEALDLGVDDNLTLPILSGALIWAWLSLTNIFF